MNIFSKAYKCLLLVLISQQVIFAQTCPSINAQAGTGASTTICSGQCANLSATVIPVNSTTSYSVGSITYAPFPYAGGTAALGNVDDLWSPAINIGFNFCYFGNTFNQLLVGSNGEITFDVSQANGPENFSVNSVLPNLTEHPGNTICVAYRDIDLTSGSNVFYYVTGTAPCRKFVVYWDNVALYQCNTPASTFQLVLHEGTNIVESFVQNSTSCAIWQSGRGLMGIQDATGTTVVAPGTRNVLTAWTATNEAWQYVPTGAASYTVNWAGPNGFTATGLTAAPCPTATSNYTATMNVVNCDGSATSFSSAVQVSVTPIPSLTITASPTVICRGSSSILTASGATSYTWSPGSSNSVSITVSPTVATTYTLRGANGNCISTTTLSLLVNNNPTLTATSSPTVICSSNSATLTSTGAATYTWNPGALVGNTVVVTPSVSTQYTVSGTNAAGCTSTRTLNLNVSSTPTIVPSASSTLACAGSTINLYGSGANTYTWTPGGITGATVVVTPTTNTTYTVNGRNAAGCVGTSTINVNVTPGISVSVTASPTIICRGGTATLTASGASTYTWSPGGMTGSTVAVSPTVNTVYSVTGEDLGCTATKTILVNVSVPTITATRNPNTTLCAGASVTLTASGGVTYTWNPGAIAGNPVVITATATTVYTVTGANALGCTNTRTISVPAAANPTINVSASSMSICSGSSATLSASGAVSYTWNPGTLTGTNVVVSPTVSTTYTVNGSYPSGCTSSNTINIAVNPSVTIVPAASPSVICPGGTSTLSATGAVSYTWNPGALTGSTVSVTPSLNTTYSVTGMDAAGCTNATTLSVGVSSVTVSASSNPPILCSTSSATLTGTGATSYTWNPGMITGNPVVVNPAITTQYTVTGENAIGCSATATLNLVVGTAPTVTAAATSSTICAGNTVTLTTGGANTYTWMPGSLTGSNVAVSPTVTTTYTVNGENASGCIGTETIVIDVNPAPAVIASNTPLILCSGSTATLTASGADTYTWNPGAMTGSVVTVSPLVTTVYSIVATSSLNCTGTATVNLKVTNTPTINTSATPTIVCAGTPATLSATGAVIYTWNPGALNGNSVVVTPTMNTTYTVTGDNGFGCTSTSTVALAVNAAPVLTVNTSPALICSGGNATLTALGATNYTWNPGALTGSMVTVNPSVTTNYTVTGEDGIGCTGTATIDVNVSPALTITAVSNPTVLCTGGTATLTGSGAASYTWSPGALTGSMVTVSPGITTTYTVTGEDMLGCTATQTVTLAIGSNPTLTLTATSTSICAGATTTLNASGATSYTWEPGTLTGSSVAVSPTATTIYTVTGESAAGCVATETIQIDILATPSVTASASNTFICSGTSVVLNGTGATSYTWNPGNVNGAMTVVSPTATTVYTLTGDNGGSCVGTSTVEIIVNPTPTITATSSPSVLCTAGGSATLTANGATTYLWEPGSVIGNTIVVTPTATTEYTVSGVSGPCSNSVTVTVIVSSNPTITVSATSSVICAGSTTTLTGNGAASYTWNPGALTGSNVAVSPATTTTYTVDADNGLGCMSTETITINVNALPTLTLAITPTVLCAPGSVTLTANGANTYTWMPMATTGSVVTDNPSASTVYTVTGEDMLGCTNTGTIAVTVGIPTISIVSTPTAICVGGTATLTASGAVNYTWSPLSVNGATVTDSPTVTTTYTVTGDDGTCSATQTITLVVNPYPVVSASATSATICAGSTTTLTGNGATSYTWNPGALTGTNVAISPTTTTTYTVDGDNGLGCVASETIIINVNPAPSVSIVATPSILCAPGSVTLAASGANTYTWMPSATVSNTITDNPSVTTTYSVTGEDLLGCTSTQTLTVSVGIPTITIVSSPTAICAGSTATLTAGGALTYTWMPGAFTGSVITDAPLATTDYTVTGDNGGCIGTETITLVVNPIPTVTATATSSVICAGSTTTLTANGATSYTWNPGALTGTNVAVSPTTTTTYTVDGDNGLGCIGTETIIITVNPAPSVSIAATPSVLCVPGSVTLTASGANTYTWMPSATVSNTITDNPSVTTTYSVTGEDALGCTATQTLTVSVGSPTLILASTPTVICAGSTATLTASGATSYTWAPLSVNGATITDTPTITTTYTVTGDNGGCIGTETITLVVNSIPTLTATTSATLICAGSSATLTGNGATSYTWNPGAVTGTNVVVTPTATTTYTVDGDNGSGCVASETITINVNTAPTISITPSSTLLCGPGTVTLTASSGSAVSYTWMPAAAVTTSITDTPTITTTYSVTGEDAIGCANTETITITVGANPTLTLAAAPSTICAGTTATLTAMGAASYTWMPGTLTGSMVTDAPLATTIYTVTGDDGVGCVNTETVTVDVVTGAPAMTVSASPTLICEGSTTTLTATGATSYTWMPLSMSGASVTATPTVSTTYTVLGDNGLCVSSATVQVDVNSLPANVTATLSSDITCATPTISLLGSTTSTNVTYLWNGPSSYTSGVQNPSDVTAPGDYTLTVSDAVAGCSSTATVTVLSNTVVPVVGVASPQPSIGCNPTVTLSVITGTTVTYDYAWSGPSSFTSTVASPTTTVAGDYTVTVTDPSNGCGNTVVLTIGTNTLSPAFTATAVPATCSGTVANSDGAIIISGYSAFDTYDLSQATTYTGTATYATGNAIPFGGILTNTLANPVAGEPYTIRVFSNNGCFADVTVTLTPTDCSLPVNALGMTKAVSTPTFVNNNAYNVTYTVVATNVSTVNINNFNITDDLTATFPAPTAFSVISTPSVTSINSSLTVNPTYDGSTQTNLIMPATSTLTASKVDTIVFTVQINPNGFFGPFYNSAVGSGTDDLGAAAADSSNTGFQWDPDGDGNPTNNNIPTVLNLVPNSSIGVAKTGSVSEVLGDKTVDVTYVFTVQNLGNDTIRNVQVLDTLVIPAPAQFYVKSGPSTTTLSANTNYNGVSDIRLLDGQGKLAPGQIETITIVVNIKPEGVKTITNTAIGVGFGQLGNVVRDSSNTDGVVDPNGNGNATEPGENVPTVVTLPDVELFIPEVFTPDGDGKNDFFVIKGISGRTVKITVFNRWGNTVYENDAYDNTWDGVANVKSLVFGSNKLPQGTYYYIVEFEDGKDDPIKGYVVLQY